jgi:hypothetical protein
MDGHAPAPHPIVDGGHTPHQGSLLGIWSFLWLGAKTLGAVTWTGVGGGRDCMYKLYDWLNFLPSHGNFIEFEVALSFWVWLRYGHDAVLPPFIEFFFFFLAWYG